MKLPTINHTVLVATVLACATAVWCVERLRPAERPRFQYFEDSTKHGHYIVEVDTVTGDVNRVPTSGKYSGRFYRSAQTSALDQAWEYICEPVTHVYRNARFATEASKIDWGLTAAFLGTLATFGCAATLARNAAVRKTHRK
jgi:hypothetical protein